MYDVTTLGTFFDATLQIDIVLTLRFTTVVENSRCQFHQHFCMLFLYERLLRNFFLVIFWPWRKDFGTKNVLLYKKRVCKIMMKLTPGFQLVCSLIHFKRNSVNPRWQVPSKVYQFFYSVLL